MNIKFHQSSLESEILPQEEMSPESFAIVIERELMSRYFREKSSVSASQWIEEFSSVYREFFNENKDDIINKYKNNPEDAYLLIEKHLYKNQKYLF